MTIQEAKDALLAWMREQIGTHEGYNNYNPYAEVEGIKKLYGWDVQYQPWCSIFVGAGFLSVFGFDKGAAMMYEYPSCNGAACKYAAEYYQQNGAWYDTPEPGDQIFFWSSGTIGHTGIVEEVRDGYVVTIEGNTSDMVARRKYQLGSSNIVGYGRPNWVIATYDTADEPDLEPIEPVVPEPVKPEPVKPEPVKTPSYHLYKYKVELNLLKKGNHGPLVRSVQALLNDAGYECPVNGEYDDETFRAVVRFQIANNLLADGEVGGKTYSKLFYR